MDYLKVKRAIRKLKGLKLFPKTVRIHVYDNRALLLSATDNQTVYSVLLGDAKQDLDVVVSADILKDFAKLKEDFDFKVDGGFLYYAGKKTKILSQEDFISIPQLPENKFSATAPDFKKLLPFANPDNAKTRNVFIRVKNNKLSFRCSDTVFIASIEYEKEHDDIELSVPMEAVFPLTKGELTDIYYNDKYVAFMQEDVLTLTIRQEFILPDVDVSFSKSARFEVPLYNSKEDVLLSLKDNTVRIGGIFRGTYSGMLEIDFIAPAKLWELFKLYKNQDITLYANKPLEPILVDTGSYEYLFMPQRG